MVDLQPGLLGDGVLADVLDHQVLSATLSRGRNPACRGVGRPRHQLLDEVAVDAT